MLEVSKEAAEQARELLRSLHPVELDANGLASALQDLAERTAEQVPCTFVCPEEVAVGATDAAAALYRIAQEAVLNFLRHGRAERLSIGLHARQREVILKGAFEGPSLDRPLEIAFGSGFQIMRYRASAIGAKLELRDLGNGAAVRCVLALED